ncbi:MAG TPA: hypothetical protein DEB30_02840 [Candidatus Peribacter riflensis]|uniref:DUF5673 domain-containing protein n=1 Tax=Candidatus Peribacter riflensis TaxID=1735162 RepID=A0A0S1SEY8_9BACT|nr:MAG: hypothetical protein PeribacterA2_0581 [Candidatus Peribacter riflensis]OGJ77108.1 MAG: hypothetical protein A2398_03240 [Candidatus Peribacteria bacterium RIFOXYB1_FULL_57_12]OGJ79043.1 MAG: hypothetical protein A2412_00605 [Candidatus Peribacteria bacterium RIFOXYC1_FULL_58_8]ALM11058.1 MAG: hypothetical protein PeribacterB2_0580 [Candidatus Peribacter riflensis]ALM12161.1 MAG: hypothetical protein PeribacterC2_0580 [Candidatus Peribacter riflensis]
MTDTHTLISWTAPERPPHNRGKRWYLIAGVIAALLFGYALFTQAWTFALVIALLAVTYAIIHHKPPLSHSVQVTAHGLTWDKTIIPWSVLSGFWMLQGPGYIELHIERKKSGGRLTVQTGDCVPLEIAETLSQFIPLIQDRRENILDYIIRICKL